MHGLLASAASESLIGGENETAQSHRVKPGLSRERGPETSGAVVTHLFRRPLQDASTTGPSCAIRLQTLRQNLSSSARFG